MPDKLPPGQYPSPIRWNPNAVSTDGADHASTSGITDMFCPKCDKMGQANMVSNNPPHGLQCALGHSFEDLFTLLSEGPRIVPKKQRVDKPILQAGDVQAMVFIKPDDYRALQVRYGERLPLVLNDLTASFAQPGAFMVAGLDLAKITEIAGQRIPNGLHLLGLLESYKTQLQQMQTDLEAAKQNQSSLPTVPKVEEDGTLPVYIRKEIVEGVGEIATKHGTSVANYLNVMLRYALDNQLFE